MSVGAALEKGVCSPPIKNHKNDTKKMKSKPSAFTNSKSYAQIVNLRENARITRLFVQNDDF
jgi:hypothetical protein